LPQSSCNKAVLCGSTKEQAEAMKRELSEFLEKELKLTLSMEKTKVTFIKDGFTFLGFLIEKGIGEKGRCVPRIRIPLEAVHKIRIKYQMALSPHSHRDSVRTKILGINRITRGWCHYYQTTSSPSYFFSKLSNDLFWLMAHWLGRKYKLTMPRVMRKFCKGNTFGTNSVTLLRLTDFEAVKYRVKSIGNPYTAKEMALEREETPNLDHQGLWERRPGQADLREMIYLRDEGICGMCGKWVPLYEAILDHKTPYAKFEDKRNADKLDNLWILHKEPCNREKTKRDLQVLSRMR